MVILSIVDVATKLLMVVAAYSRVSHDDTAKKRDALRLDKWSEAGTARGSTLARESIIYCFMESKRFPMLGV
jgi:hypothetical protein